MNKSLLLLIIVLLFNTPSFSQSKEASEKNLDWYTEVSQVHLLSKENNRPVFAFFTGSDWCGWCHKLQRDVLTKPAFIEWAKDNVILLELDFPRKKQLPLKLLQQNQTLQQFFQVAAFPTIWVFSMSQDSDKKTFLINPICSLGYPKEVEIGREEIKFLEDAKHCFAKRQ
jgi:thiol-disulfide isomerase/thioredoxin